MNKNLPINYSIYDTVYGNEIPTEQYYVIKYDKLPSKFTDISLSYEPEIIEGFKSHLEKFKPIIIIEVLETKVAEKLNTLFDLSEYLIFHLCGFKQAKQIKRFSAKHPFYNFIIFHKDVEKKVRENTSLFENLNWSLINFGDARELSLHRGKSVHSTPRARSTTSHSTPPSSRCRNSSWRRRSKISATERSSRRLSSRWVRRTSRSSGG